MSGQRECLECWFQGEPRADGSCPSCGSVDSFSSDGPLAEDYRVMPDFIEQHDGFQLLTPEQRVAWFGEMGAKAKALGCVYLRYTASHPEQPTRGLVEGWQRRQDPERMLPVQWRNVDRKPVEGVVSAIEDISGVVAPRKQPQQEIRA